MSTGLSVKNISIILVVSTFVLQLFFFAPLQVLAQNFSEFSVRFIDVLAICLVFSIALIIILFLLVKSLNSFVILAALTLFSTIAFLQSRFFLALAEHRSFDGKPVDWDAFQWLSYPELATVTVLAILFFVFRKRQQLLSTVSVFILIFLAGGSFYQMGINYAALWGSSGVVSAESQYFDQFYQLSNQRNVIHIVPDQTQGATMYDILGTNPEHYSAVFDGFTLFTQATGRFRNTYPSVSYYMTGESPEPANDLVPIQSYSRDYIAETLRKRSIVTLLSGNNFRTFGFNFYPGFYCKGPYTACTGTHDEVFAGMEVNSPAKKLVLTALTGFDLALFQASPVILRERIYDEGNWFARKLVTGRVSHAGILDAFNAAMQVGDHPDTYNYFHLAGAHAPLLFDRNCRFVGPQVVDQPNERGQAQCTLVQLEKLIRRLKEKDAYDQTMIVIHGDHGSPWLPPSFANESDEKIPESLMGMASTFLLIKPPGQRGPLEYSDQMVSIGDIPATIAGVLDIDNDYSGLQIFNEEAAGDRERHFYDYDSTSMEHRLGMLKNMRHYRIRGNVFDARNWQSPDLSSVAYEQAEQRALPLGPGLDDADFDQISEGFSFLEQHDVPARWVDGNRAKLRLSTPSDGPLALVFKSHVAAHIDGQWMEILIDGRLVAKLDEKELVENMHIVALPEDLTGASVIEVEFNMGKAEPVGKDSRQLSVLFKYIALESVESEVK